MFENLTAPAADPLYQVAQAYTDDDRPEKVDLGVGVYKDADGKASIMRCVQQAEIALAPAGTTKAYLPQSGAPLFVEGMTRLLFGDRERPDMAAVQTIGGTGGVRLAIEAARAANPDVTAHLGVPSWPNHAAICKVVGVPVRTFAHCTDDSARASAESALAALDRASKGDILILHGPCHNPTGLDYTADELFRVLDKAKARGVVPLVDAAYYGLGNLLDDDLALLSRVITAAPEAMMVLSCSKAFGLYRDRIGILMARCKSAADADIVQKTLQITARTTYSGPAAHGGEVVGHILAQPGLKAMWKAELAEMRARVIAIRASIAQAGKGHAALEAVRDGRGIFAMLPLSSGDTKALARDFAVFMPENGRVNLAGLRQEDVTGFVKAVRSRLE